MNHIKIRGRLIKQGGLQRVEVNVVEFVYNVCSEDFYVSVILPSGYNIKQGTIFGACIGDDTLWLCHGKGDKFVVKLEEWELIKIIAEEFNALDGGV